MPAIQEMNGFFQVVIQVALNIDVSSKFSRLKLNKKAKSLAV